VGVRALVLDRLRAGRVLHGLDLAGADLHGLDFTGGVMLALDLRRANLRGCVLTGAKLTAARLEGADLSDANLVGADLSRADLSGAVLLRARLDGAALVDTVGLPPASLEEGVASEPDPPAPAPHAEETPAAPEHVEAEPVPDEPPPAPPLRGPPEAPEARWARWAGAQQMGETEEVSVAAFRGVPLPFVEGPPDASFFAAADAARAEPRQPQGTTGDETMALPVTSVHELRDGKITRWTDYWDMALLVSSAPQWWFEHVMEGWK